MEAISREFRIALPWELLYAGDLAVIAETEEELMKRLNVWKENVESKGKMDHYYSWPLQCGGTANEGSAAWTGLAF